MTSMLTPLYHLFQRSPDATKVQQSASALRLLPRRTRQILLLSRVDALPYADIAVRLDISVQAVENEMVKALERSRPLRLASSGSLVASQWYVRLQSPQATASERIDFRRWLDADPNHLAAFHETELHWRRLLIPAEQLASTSTYQHKHRRLEVSAWLAGLTSVIVLALLAL